MAKIRIFFVSTLAIIFCSLGFTATAEENESSLVFALKPNKNPEKMLSEKESLEKQLAVYLKRPVKVLLPISSAVILQGFANGTIDLGYLSSVDMITAMKKESADVLLAGEIKGKTYYESVWLVKKGSPHQNIADLQGQPVAFASRTSTSGFLIPYWDLIKSKRLSARQDPAAFFGQGNVWYGTGYVSAVQRLLSGAAQAAAVSDYVYFGQKHLSGEQKSQLRILQRQGPVPTHMIAVRKTLTGKKRDQVMSALMQINQENPELRDQVFTSKLVTVEPKKHLASTKEALQLTGFSKD